MALSSLILQVKTHVVRVLILSVACAAAVSAQEGRYIDPNKGNVVYTKKGIMDGNNVRTLYLNHGEIALWPNKPS
ncbi:MAG: hypothetical protein WD295_01115, partial [Bacteroidota bacterium]